MSSYIAENRTVLSERHYIRKAGTQEYWFDFSSKKLNGYRKRFGDDFCLVLFGSEAEDDAYIIPYTQAKELFTNQNLDHRNRWIGNIKDNLMRLSPGSKSMSVSAFYNAFEFLDGAQPNEAQDSIIFEQADDIDLDVLRDRIRSFNEKYRDAVPHKKRTVSEEVARPGGITDYLKKIHAYTCQLCGERGFLQRNKIPYVEAHHIVELHKLIPDSYCSDNIVIVCPTCHRKLHYATVLYEIIDGETVIAHINGADYEFKRNTLAAESGAV